MRGPTLLLTAWLLAAGGAAAAPSGEEVYRAKCSLCHDGGATGAPRVGYAPDWSVRLARGTSALHRSALDGIPNTAMTAKGGYAELPDEDVIAAADFMLSTLPVPAAAASQAQPVPQRSAASSGKVGDEVLVARVAEALRAQLAPAARVEKHDGTRIAGIKIEARGGRVVLSGVVNDNAAVRKAEQAALGVAGVGGVENKLLSAELFEHD
jgi:cytochrome c5